MRALFDLGTTFLPDDAVALVRVWLGYANGTRDEKPSWCREEGSLWILVDGFRLPKCAADRVGERVVVRGGDWRSIHWADTTLLRATSPLGWLSPEGAWYGCASVWHGVVAELVFGMTERELHQTYARIREGSFVSPPTATGRLTSAQATWLRARGYALSSDSEAYERAEVDRWVAASGRPLRRNSGSGD